MCKVTFLERHIGKSVTQLAFTSYMYSNMRTSKGTKSNTKKFSLLLKLVLLYIILY